MQEAGLAETPGRRRSTSLRSERRLRPVAVWEGTRDLVRGTHAHRDVADRAISSGARFSVESEGALARVAVIPRVDLCQYGGLHSRETVVMGALLTGLTLALLVPLASHAAEPDPGAEAFKREIDVRLEVPAREQADYAKRLDAALARAGIEDARPQYFLLIDRSPRVQAAFLYWRSPEGVFRLVGATPAATGRPGEYEHFLTPLGAFAHSLANPDFRAEGTRNAAGILGYGAKGMRVYDFGWSRPSGPGIRAAAA
jgi:hypothetical protein